MNLQYITDDFGNPSLNKYSRNNDFIRFSFSGPDPLFKNKILPALGLNFLEDKEFTYYIYAEVDKMSSGENKAVFGFIGGVIFIIYGVYNFFKKKHIESNPAIESPDIKMDYAKSFLKGFLLNFANPMVLFYWFSVLTLANQSLSEGDSDFMIFLFLFIVLITFLGFDLLKIVGAKKLKPLVTENVLIGLNRLIGLVFFLFGIVLVIQNYFRISPLL